MFDKIYKENNKFSGIGNNFNFKITIFFNKCKYINLLVDNNIQSAFIMLLG